MLGDIAGGEYVRVRSAQAFIYFDAAIDIQPGTLGQLGVRVEADAENDHVETAGIPDHHDVHATLVVFLEGENLLLEVQAQIVLRHEIFHDLAGAGAELPRHELPGGAYQRHIGLHLGELLRNLHAQHPHTHHQSVLGASAVTLYACRIGDILQGIK